MRLLKSIFIFLTFFSMQAYSSDSAQYLNVLGTFYKENSVESFIELEKTFEGIADRDMKSKISFILASSEFETKINNKSYYALYALKFYKGKDAQMLEDSYLQVITIFYYQKNLPKAKIYLDELSRLEKLSSKAVMLSKYYRGLMYASEKEYVNSINYWTSNISVFKKSDLGNVIYKEIARSYLLENVKKSYRLNDKTIYQNAFFINGIRDFSAIIENDSLLKILANLEKEDNVKYFSAGLLASPALLNLNCGFLPRIESLKKNNVNFNDYFNLLKYCSSEKKNQDKIYQLTKDLKLEGSQRLFRAFVNEKGNNCSDFIGILQEDKNSSEDSFIAVANGIAKDCPKDVIDQNHLIISSRLLDFLNNEAAEGLFVSFFSNSLIRNDLISSKSMDSPMKNPKLNQYFWESFSGQNQEFIKAIHSGQVVSEGSFDYVIKNIINLPISADEKNGLAKKLPSSFNAEEIVRVVTDKEYASQVLPNKDCAKLSSLEKEIFLRYLIEKNDIFNMLKNYNCVVDNIIKNEEYKEAILKLWIASDVQEEIKEPSSFSLILNFVNEEKKSQEIVSNVPSFENFSKLEELKEILILRDLKKLIASVQLLKKIEKSKNIILSIKKYNDLVTNYSWSSASTNQRAVSLFNQSIESLKNKINKIDNSPNTNVLVQRLGEWEIKL